MTRKLLPVLIFQNMTHLLPKHILRLPTTFEEVLDKWLEILQKLRRPYNNMEVGKHKPQEASQSLPRYDGTKWKK